MRRSMLVVLAAGTLTLGACEGLRDAFSAQPDVVATAAGRKLTTERMLRLMRDVPSGSITKEGAEFVANLWVDMTLFAQARVNGDLAPDSARVARVMWPQVTQVVMGQWHDTLISRWATPTDAMADSAYDAGQSRLFQHILVMPAGETARDTAAARAKIGGMLAQIQRGRPFVQFTPENNDATKDDGGFLPVGPRGQFVPQFEDVAWTLEPGQVSSVVQTPFGWHIIRRTPRDEARPRYRTWLEQTMRQVQDSAYLADLAAARGLKVQDGAAQAVRDALADWAGARKSSKKLASFNRGAFTVADLARWLEAFPPGAAFQIGQQPDSVIVDLVENLAQNTLILQQADSARLGLGEAEWEALELSYRATVDQLAAALGLSDSVIADTTLPKAARMDSATARVDRLLDQLVTGQAQFRPVPPALSGMLRENASRYRVNQAGITRVMELYAAAQLEDSAAAAAGAPAPGQPPPAIQPAPGPAPVPGGTTKQP